MTDRQRSAGNSPRQTSTSPQRSHPTWQPPGRECPWCSSRDTEFVQRGLASGQDARDQYIRCQDCGRITYDIVAKSGREVRIGRLQSGGEYRDPNQRTRYTIYRMLKIGFDEFLLYLRPVLPE